MPIHLQGLFSDKIRFNINDAVDLMMSVLELLAMKCITAVVFHDIKCAYYYDEQAAILRGTSMLGLSRRIYTSLNTIQF